MRKRFLALILLAVTLLPLYACSRDDDSTFSIRFIDVGQGDSALVECDGHYMLIDGGDMAAGDKVYNALEEKGIKQLDILVLSHLHTDHIGGLIKALTYASSIGLTISNTENSNTETFKKLEQELSINMSKITVPNNGDKYELGSAVIEVIDVCADEDNDSLVLLITYGDTRFLFTGDIEDAAQTRISDKYQNESDEPFGVNLMKMPHHGSYTGTLYRFLRTFMPEHIVISVGAGNSYGHPHQKTLDLLDDLLISSQNAETLKRKYVYRTDIDGDIIVKSNGKELYFETSK